MCLGHSPLATPPNKLKVEPTGTILVGSAGSSGVDAGAGVLRVTKKATIPPTDEVPGSTTLGYGADTRPLPKPVSKVNPEEDSVTNSASKGLVKPVISPIKTSPDGPIQAQDQKLNSVPMGFDTLGEYEKAFPVIDREQREGLEAARSFAQLMNQIERESAAKAAKYRQLEQEALARARSLEKIPGDQPETKHAQAPSRDPRGLGMPSEIPQSDSPGSASPQRPTRQRENNPVPLSPSLSTVAKAAREKIDRPDSFIPKGTAGENSAAAVANAYAGKASLDQHQSTIAISRKTEAAVGVVTSPDLTPEKIGAVGGAKRKISSRERTSLRDSLRASSAVGAATADPVQRPDETIAQSGLRGAIDLASSAAGTGGAKFAAGGSGFKDDPLAAFGKSGINGEAHLPWRVPRRMQSCNA